MAGDTLDRMMQYSKDNPDTLAKVGAAFMPAFGLGGYAPGVNTAAGLYGIANSDARNKDWAIKKAAADKAIADYKTDPTKNPAPTADQVRTAAGQDLPPSQGDIAERTMLSSAEMAQNAVQAKQKLAEASQKPLGPQISSGGPLPFTPHPIFSPGGSQRPSMANPGTMSQDQLARLLVLLQQQKSGGMGNG